jgi:predicted RNase H-like nuclease (RuvC/YqgF family)
MCLQLKDAQNQREIERLEAEVRRLEGLCREQTVSISNLERSISSSTQSNDRKQETAASTISALTSELRTTKQALEDVTTREQQVKRIGLGDARRLRRYFIAVCDERRVTCVAQFLSLSLVWCIASAACAIELAGGQSGVL